MANQYRYQYTPAKIEIQVNSEHVQMPTQLVRRLIDGDVLAKTEVEKVLAKNAKVCITEGTKIQLKVHPIISNGIHHICGSADIGEVFDVGGIRMQPTTNNIIFYMVNGDTELKYKGPLDQILNVITVVDQQVPKPAEDVTSEEPWIEWDPRLADDFLNGAPDLDPETIVRVKFASGEISEPAAMCEFNWAYYDYEYDIFAYQVIKYPD